VDIEAEGMRHAGFARSVRNPYHILISEVMLQQTQVSRVVLYYHRWLERFPAWTELAAATNAEVIAMWSGLGYNRRGLMLRDIARMVVAEGEPTSEEGWRRLKGIGPYTAAAITCFSLHKRTLPIDTNIRRVGARLWLGIPFPDAKDDESIRQAAETFLPTRGRFYDIPQALFDLASSICTKMPACPICPMREICPSAKLFLSGTVVIPKQSIKKAFETKHRDKPYPDRIYRGRILKNVQKQEPLHVETLGKLIDPDFDYEHDQAWLLRMLDRMEKDGFIKISNGFLQVYPG
jgi:A/G-specific adenine glycosylase